MRKILHLAFALLLSGCAFSSGKDHFGAHAVSYSDLAGWQEDDHAQGLATFIASCTIFADKARGRSSGSGLKIDRDVWRSVCSEAQAIPPGNRDRARQFFERRFTPFRITNNDKEQGLFTGYYEPVLYGSRRKQGNYKYPLYRAPADLKNRKPYYTHAQIDRGVLRNRGLELVWVDDPVMIFFLQIQGSGRVRLAEGGEMQIGYADQNGRQYESLGKIFGDEGLIPKDQINFFTLRQWLYDHPKQAFAMMERNPSYVFFKELDRFGAVGAAGSVLVPQRSMAVDSSYIPYGLPLFLQTQLPSVQGSPTAFNRVMVAQDTGGAIRGPVRGDIFFGPGPDAEYLAGYMKGHGVYNLLVPVESASQLR
jgi:membrane-bound lytic murein transglycosylase A